MVALINDLLTYLLICSLAANDGSSIFIVCLSLPKVVFCSRLHNRVNKIIPAYFLHTVRSIYKYSEDFFSVLAMSYIIRTDFVRFLSATLSLAQRCS